MCEYLENIKTDTKFVILMHPKEFKKVKNNTGAFTHRTLSNSELFVGIDFSDHRRVNEIIATHDGYVLFPSKNSINLSEVNPKKSEKSLAIFIIDSTWACTKKIFTQSKNLHALKHMSFTTTKASQYQIKEQPHSDYLSTIESALVVLELLNKWGLEEISETKLDAFLNPFLKMIEYQQEIINKRLPNSLRCKELHGIMSLN